MTFWTLAGSQPDSEDQHLPLYLVRHGETDWNRARRFQSRSDIPLNETGRRQAEQIRSRFERDALQFAAVKSSPLGRATQTAAIILQGTDTPVDVDLRLIEISLGEFEGELEADLSRNMGPAFVDWRAQYFRQAAPGGESVFEAMLRASDALTELSANALAENLLVVAHQGINMAIMATISGRSDVESLADFRQRNDQVEIWDLEKRKRIGRIDAN